MGYRDRITGFVAPRLTLDDQYGYIPLAELTHCRIREYFVTHPGATSKDASRDLGLSMRTISTYRPQIKAEWNK